MLKVEYTCREILSSYPNPAKPVVTWTEAKKHLHEVRLRRQNQLASNINQCHKLRNIHKQIFNRQFDSNSIEKLSDTKPISHEYSLSTHKFSIPRIEYAPVIYRQAVPTFELDKSVKLENEIPIVKELTEYLSESSCPISNKRTENHPSFSSKKKNRQRPLSVSPISSTDKQTNKVYEKWPDYNRISEIVGYHIDPPVSKTITSTRPSDALTQRKQNKSAGFPAASKQIKNVIGLNPSLIRRQTSKNKKSTKSDLIPAILDPPLPPTNISKVSIKEIKPTLPSILCPSSVMYSNRIQTRQWLIRNHFSSNAFQTLPLL